MPSRLKKAIGAVKDQTSISLAKVNSSSNLKVAVLKATTHDDVPIDERYIKEILHLVSSNKAYAAACARAIAKRITRTRNWIVALKSLMVVLRVVQDGDPYFPREVVHATKRGGKISNLSNFRDESSSSYAAFVRTFGLYLDERLACFLTGKLQRRYTMESQDFRGFRKRTNDLVRYMKPSMLLDRIHYRQRLLERAIATRPTGAARDNRLVQVSLYAVVRESFDLYKYISDGLALTLDGISNLQYESCVNAYEICVKAEKQFEELDGFYSLCKSIGVGKDLEYPTVEMISREVIETLKELSKDESSSPSPTQNPCILIDLETYSDQSEKRSQQEESIRASDTDSVVDLLSLDDWPTNEEHKEHQEQETNKVFEYILMNELSQSTPSQWWDLVQAESVTPASHSQGNSLGGSTNSQAQNGLNEDWELVLARTPAHQQPTRLTDISSNTFDASTSVNSYNPFLQEIPSFQGNNPFSMDTGSYWVQNQSNVMNMNDPFTIQAQNDPFKEDDPFATRMRSGYTLNEQKLIQEQQLWLQNQNKIIARHMTNV